MTEMIQQIGEQSHSGVFICNLMSLRLQYVNRGFSELFDLEPIELQHHPGALLAIISTEDIHYLQRRHSELITSGVLRNTEFCMSVNGRQRYLQCDAYVLGDVVAGFVRDVSLEKQAEHHLIVHATQADLILHQLSKGMVVTENGLEEKPNTHLLFPARDTMNGFLDHEDDVIEMMGTRYCRFELMAALRGLLDDLGKRYPNQRFNLISSQQSLPVTTDGLKLFRLLHHILLNAILHASSSPKIDVIVESDADRCFVSVKDYGPGIPAYIIEELFTRNIVDERNKSGLMRARVLAHLLKGDLQCQRHAEGTNLTLSIQHN